jgi:hypothetical protein
MVWRVRSYLEGFEWGASEAEMCPVYLSATAHDGRWFANREAVGAGQKKCRLDH